MAIKYIDSQFLSKNVLFNQFFPFQIFRDLYLVYIEQLPLYNPPDILGLHANAEINYLSKTTQEIYSNLLNIQPEHHEINNNSSQERKYFCLLHLYIKILFY